MRAAAMLLMGAVVGCGGPTGPASTNTTSDALPSLAQRVEFLERYVTFRRQYQELGFHIVYHNNGGGGVPGPSDWDIRVVAVVPPEQLPQWIPADGAAAPAADAREFAGVPGAERAAGITEWYTGRAWRSASTESVPSWRTVAGRTERRAPTATR